MALKLYHTEEPNTIKLKAFLKQNNLKFSCQKISFDTEHLLIHTYKGLSTISDTKIMTYLLCFYTHEKW